MKRKSEGEKMETVGVEFLKHQLQCKRQRVLTRYCFYEMKNAVPDFNISTPPSLRQMVSVLGWCGKAVDSLADRLQLNSIENDVFGIADIFSMNNQDIMIDSAIIAALIGACSFVYISPDDVGFPRMQVIDGAEATGIYDPITGMLHEGYAVIERDPRSGTPTLQAHFLPEQTEFWGRENMDGYTVDNPAKYPLLVPIVFRPDNRRPFGRSRISRACMSTVQAAARTIKRSEISAEFYSFPQKYAVGLSEDVEIRNRWAAAMSTMFTVSKDEDGDKPTVGQFTQQSMSPHIEQLRMFASVFASETGLTLDDLGFVSDNPASVEAIKAAHEGLRLTARKAQRNFATGLLNAGFVAASVRDEFPYERTQLAQTKMIWQPLFEPDAAALAGIGDAVLKVNQAIPSYIGRRNMYELTGFAGDMNG